MRVSAAILAAVVLSACRDVPAYPVPEQSPSFEDFTVRTTRIVDLARPGAGLHVLRDIIGDSSLPWRWTLQHPAVKIKIGFARDYQYVVDFTIPEVTFKDTGPVAIAFTINGRVLDRVRYDAPGPKHFAKPVPPDWIEPHGDLVAGADIDKVWVSKADGARLGFILSRMGLAGK